MIVISHSLVLTPAVVLSADNGVILWQNLVTSSNVAADTEDPLYPAVNLAYPETNSRWQGEDTSEQRLIVNVDTVEDLDSLAVAKHNFGSGNIVTSVEGRLDVGDPWTELVQEVQLADDAPVLYRFEPQPLAQISLLMQPTATIPRAAVLYAGLLTVLQRGIYVGHTPITDGLITETVNHRSINGHYLGTTVLSRHNMTAVALANLTPAWYRTYLRPFITARVPFFFAWKPLTYPREVGYGWFPDGHNPKPSNQRNNGMMQVSWQMEGVT